MKTAICLIVKNEARGICEWILYHHLIGFDCIVVYDNASTDDTEAVLSRLKTKLQIIYIPWPSTERTYQLDAYNHALRLLENEYDWVAFLDSDEFLVLLDDTDIKSFLSRFADRSGIALNWAIYGSCGHIDIPDGLVIENFLTRAPDDFGPNQHVKVIVRPQAAKSCINPHYFKIETNYANVHGEDVVWQSDGVAAAPVTLSVARVNHYFTRSRGHWAEKLKRGYHDVVREENMFIDYDRNEIRDECALKVADAVRKLMARYGFVDGGRTISPLAGWLSKLDGLQNCFMGLWRKMMPLGK